MITYEDFNIFDDPTLEGRLAKIRTQLDPKFERIGTQMIANFEADATQKFYLHIAKHLRRHKNPPPDTWFAIGEGARGYKMLPHFEVGLWPDQLFIWFALLAEVPERQQYGAKLRQLAAESTLWAMSDLVIAKDHTQPKALSLTPANFEQVVRRFETTKKGEFMIGRLIPKTAAIFTDEQAQQQLLTRTMTDLFTIYQKIGSNPA